MNNNQNMGPNTNLNDYLNSTQGQVQNQPVVNNNVVNNVPNVVPNQVPNTQGMNQMPMNQQPKKNNSMTIIIIVVALLLVGVGGFVVYKAFSNEGSTSSVGSGTETGDKENKEEEKPEVKDEKVKEYSEYNNYKVKMNITAEYLGYTITADSEGTVDVKNSTDYLETKTNSAGEISYAYTYDDYIAGISYSSTDKINWYRSETEGTESVNLDDLIEKINNKSDDVTSLGNGEYEVDMAVEDSGMNYGSVPVKVKTTNGFISRLEYDFTPIYSSFGYTKYIITMDLSDFNTVGDVVIPANVIASSTEEL